MEMKRNSGVLVISLDFELMWGMRDIIRSEDNYTLNIINARKAIPRILDLFQEYQIGTTWATVGFLFAESRIELEQYSPQLKPYYNSSKLDPYQEDTGMGEFDDPFHYAPQLINYIQKQNRQEIATHTFSHYYCLEKGQTREMFSADLDSSLAIAKKFGIQIRSVAFPRNQHNHDYDDILLKKGILCYRGNRLNPMYSYGDKTHHFIYKRLYRLVDTYLNLSGNHLISWDETVEKSGLCNIRESFFLRPNPKMFSVFNNLRLKRITQAMTEAAKMNKIFHLWWHPHNFGSNLDQKLEDLKTILEHFKACQKYYGMISLNMGELANILKI